MSGTHDTPRKLSQQESLAALDDLWDPPSDNHEQAKAGAWARRSLGLDASPSDTELLAEVDRDLAVKYGLRPAS